MLVTRYQIFLALAWLNNKKKDAIPGVYTSFENHFFAPLPVFHTRKFAEQIWSGGGVRGRYNPPLDFLKIPKALFKLSASVFN